MSGAIGAKWDIRTKFSNTSIGEVKEEYSRIFETISWGTSIISVPLTK